jgi:AcrR family transcriptional regulator
MYLTVRSADPPAFPAAVSASGHHPSNVRNGEPIVSSSTRPDRRVARTRQDVVSAFRALLFERGYTGITVRGIIERANIGRSTFYEHFQNKEDVLYETLAFVMTPLADTIAANRSHVDLELVTEHMWESRAQTALILLGPSRRVVQRFLASLFEARIAGLRARRRDAVPLLPVRHIAAYLAEAQLALIGTWCGADACSPAELAQALFVTTNAAANALLA